MVTSMKHEDKLKIVEKNYRMGKNIVGKSPYSMQVVVNNHLV